MKIGIMGLGTIAQKAYLPIMASMQEIDWVLHTRNTQVLKHLQSKYNFKHATSDFEDFLNSGLDACFIHTPTKTHYTYIKTMLEKGIHVYVDKPISESITETKELLELAKEKDLILMTGFNRRYAPLVQKLKAIPNKNMIVVRKNRATTQQETQFALYDMMIHVVDTALYLLDEPIQSLHSTLSTTNTTMNRAILTIETENSSLVAYMNMDSGARPETFEVMSPSVHAIVDDLNTLTLKYDDKTQIESFPDWTPTLTRRGFQGIIETFIDTVQNKLPYNTDADLLSHEVIQSILDKEPITLK